MTRVASSDSSGTYGPGTYSGGTGSATFLRRTRTNNIAPSTNTRAVPITIAPITPGEVPLVAAGGLDCCGAGGSVSGAGPGDVLLGLSAEPVVVAELPVVVSPLIVIMEGARQDDFLKRTLPEV